MAYCVVLVLLIGCSAFFSSSETGLMTLNRYRLRHRARGRRQGRDTHQPAAGTARSVNRHHSAFGNNFVNILASSLATIIALHLLGEAGIVVSTVILTLVLLVFGEVAPKTLAALHPERIAFPASAVLAPLLKVFYPLVWLTNVVANSLLRLFRVTIQTSSPILAQRRGTAHGGTRSQGNDSQTASNHAAGHPGAGEITVNDIMVPRNEVEASTWKATGRRSSPN